MKLDTILYDTMFEKVTPLLRGGREGDYQHIQSVYKKMIEMYENKTIDFNPRIGIAAGILHDCGFGFIKDEYLHLMYGQDKVMLLREVVDDLSVAHAQYFLKDYQFTPEEVEKVADIIRHSDEEKLKDPNPSIELVLLHDLNLFDRFLPHRMEILTKYYPDLEKQRKVMTKSYENIILPVIKAEARELALKYGFIV